MLPSETDATSEAAEVGRWENVACTGAALMLETACPSTTPLTKV